MLTIADTRSAHTCEGYTRREFLRIGSLGFGGFTLASLLRSQAEASQLSSAVTGKSVVFLFLNGGPSHIESFDPKMSAPSEIRAIFGEVQTKLPGITFGSHFPQLAAMADRLSVVRSYGSGNSGHSYQQVASGKNPTKATMGALYSRVVGTNHADNGMPMNVLVLPEGVDPNLKLQSNFETSALPTLTHPGNLGKTFGAFNPQGGNQQTKNMELKLARERFDDRRNLLTSIDRLKRSAAAGGLEGTDRYQQQAFDIITGGVASAFDLSREDPQTVARYDTSHLFKQEEVSRWHDMKRASNLLGKQMLLARRLCEAGCGFVTVSVCGWDHHGNVKSNMETTAREVDQPTAALIKDLKERGMLEDTLVVWGGEFGRTPMAQGNGRDHHIAGFTMWFAGGGFQPGMSYGATDELGYHAVEDGRNRCSAWSCGKRPLHFCKC